MPFAAILAFLVKYGGTAVSLVAKLLGLGGGASTTLAEQKGQADQKVVDQNAALDASRRMNEAAAEPAGRDTVQKALDDGTL